jgi:VanZ family protein
MWYSNRRYLLALSLTAIIAVVISVLTLTPINAPKVLVEGSDKLYHLIAFAALTFPSALLARPISIPVFCLAILFAAGIELIQPSVGRSREWGDFLADSVGALIGLHAGKLISRLPFSGSQ